MGTRRSLATLVVVVVVGAAGLAPAATASPRLCGHVEGTVAVSARHLDCARAKPVAIHYLNTRRGLHGFRCHRHAIQAGAGWYAVCARGPERVDITPE